MPRTLTSPSAGSTIVKPLNIHEGGTGATTAPAALNNLNAVPINKIDQPLGVASLDANSKIRPEVLPINEVSTIAIKGVNSLIVNQTSDFEITNYDVFTNYQVVALAGSVSRTSNIISYTAPGASGLSGFTINGKTVSITIEQIKPKQATIVSPVNNATQQNASTLITGSAFSMNSGSDTHYSSDWQLATDPNFDNVVQSTADDINHKTTWSVTGLSIDTAYYVRVRYKSATYGYGNWSAASTFETKLAFYASYEEAKLSASDKASNDLFGRYISISGDGTRLAVSAHGADVTGTTDAGAVYIFVRSGVSWIQETKITASDKADSDAFGVMVRLDATGTRIAIGAYNKDQTTSDAGQVYIYTRSGSVWTIETTLFPTADTAIVGSFGASLDFDSDANRLIVGAYNSDESSLTDSGSAYVYVRSGVSWTQEAKLIPNDPLAQASFGRSVAMSSDGSRVIVGAAYQTNGSYSAAGAAYIFLRAVSSWSQEVKLTQTDPAADDRFGMSVGFDASATRAVISAHMKSTTSTSQGGIVYVFSRSGTTWTQEAEIQASDNGTSLFGIRSIIDQSGTFIFVSSHVHASNELLNAGAFYAYVRSGTTWSQIALNYSSAPAANANFGIDLDITDDNTRLIVGAYNETVSGITGAGSIYIYS